MEVLARGYGQVSIADLTKAAGTTAGKLTYHFHTKHDLFEAVFDALLLEYKSIALARLAEKTEAPEDRINAYFKAMLNLYKKQPDPIGCPIGHAAGDTDGVSPRMREQAFSILRETENLFEQAFIELKQDRGLAHAKAQIFVSAWQGSVVVARAGRGIRHIQTIFRELRSMVHLGAERPNSN
jgi:AcrR family transcriptional regulator